MSIESELSKSLLNFFKPKCMNGGSISNNPSFSSFFLIFIVFLILLLIKAFIVQIAYNAVMPSILYSLDVKNKSSFEEIKSNFRNISFIESLLLVILFNLLFNKT